jgi:flavin reductase (DIM6/NTAB) family NADH-FMN oxidoreductase RutF
MHDLELTDLILRRLDREVWIVTSADVKRRGGLVATWVSSASIDADRPALVIGVAPNHFTCELIDASKEFAAHLIGESQIELAWAFGIGSGRDRDKFLGLEASTAITGSPVLSDCLAWLDCKVISRLDTGDRVYFWGEVVASANVREGAPLREQGLFKAASDQQLRQLREGRDHDIDVHRPLYESWLENMPQLLKPITRPS